MNTCHFKMISIRSLWPYLSELSAQTFRTIHRMQRNLTVKQMIIDYQNQGESLLTRRLKEFAMRHTHELGNHPAMLCHQNRKLSTWKQRSMLSLHFYIPSAKKHETWLYLKWDLSPFSKLLPVLSKARQTPLHPELYHSVPAVSQCFREAPRKNQLDRKRV